VNVATRIAPGAVVETAVPDADHAEIAWMARLRVEAVLAATVPDGNAACAELAGAKRLGFDIETKRKLELPPSLKKDDKPELDPYRAEIATVQLYAGHARAFVYAGAAKDYLLASGFLCRPQLELVSHNAQFESAFCQRAGVALAPLHCTLHMHKLLFGPPHDLATAWKDVFGDTPPKSQGVSNWAAENLSEAQKAYACADSIMTWALAGYMRPRIERGRRQIAYDLAVAAIPAVCAMELKGLGFDSAEHGRQLADWKAQRERARVAYYALTSTEPPKAGAETIALVEQQIADRRLRGWPLTPKGKLKTARGNLKRLADDPAVEILLKFRAMGTLISSFGAPLREAVHPITGRLHAHYKIAEARTGRFTCADRNLQQLPSTRAPEFRKMIVAAPGNRLIVGDLNQIELRVFAQITSCKEMQAAYAEGRDLHTETARAMTRGVAFDQLTPEQRQSLRSRAKPINFGAIYGMGARALADYAFTSYDVVMSEGEARAALDGFFARYPMRDWLRRHERICQARNYIEIPTSGRIVAAAWLKEKRLRFSQCANLPTQGAAADVLLRTVKLVDDRLPGTLVACIHDELILETPEADAEAAARALTEIMTAAFVEFFPTAPTRGLVKVGAGVDWHGAKP
jgi:DNA polymerase I